MRQRNLVLVRLFTFLLLMSSFNAFSFSLKVGSSYFLKSHKADHDKYGVALGMSFFENKKRRIVIDGKIGVATIDPVNPGAGSNPTAPDEKEEYSGSYPLYTHILYEKLEGSNRAWKIFGIGTTIFTPDLSAGTNANFFSESITLKEKYFLFFTKRFTLHLGAIVSFGISKQLPYMLIPGGGISYLISKYVELDLSYESNFLRFFGEGGKNFRQNILSLNLIFPNQF